MNQTAILHATAAVIAGGGFLVSERLLKFGLFGLAGLLFVAGIVVARRGDGGSDPIDGA
ncbi:hypothetical protein [Halorientalis regularis]|jgi:hypothetical protein|uniref:Uncharacterized protein n=1 Tax=Halorientalis regularis TaxID=660518 RepID=A0A1G7GM69_9EURY|nr:hypothetical protein [Halorientalis regularis]SDE89237.1 hypothetical protein SAMN05216218_102104 [Halorientalis regularis]